VEVGEMASNHFSRNTVTKEIRIFIGTNDAETVLKCDVTLLCEAGQSQAWDCPGYEPSVEIIEIKVGDTDITPLFDMDSDAMETLLEEIKGDWSAEALDWAA